MTLRKLLKVTVLLILAGIPAELMAATTRSIPTVFNIRPEFIIFALTLIGVAFFHKQTMWVAVCGLLLIILFKTVFVPGFSFFHHITGSPEETGEWYILTNLLGLLIGFAILARHFQESKVPDILPNYLPDDWRGGFVLLLIIMVISSFLDNIAAAMIGGTIAMIVFKGKVHLGYLAAIIAASNAGGAGSVVGDTTTTLMWIDGVHPLAVTSAFIASVAAVFIFGIIASIQQDRYQRIQKDATVGVVVDFGKLFIVLAILIGAIVANALLSFPALGVWVAILIGALIRKTSWNAIPKAIPGTIFLCSLVASASMMPVEQLPPASWHSAFSLGFISAVFDNIPLTKLCLEQGGYDWGMLAFTVGFGGSMIWFGSSAGVALSNIYPEAKSTVDYIKKGWHVPVAYVISFFIMLALSGWHPTPEHGVSKPLTTEKELLKPVEKPDKTNTVSFKK